MSVPSVSVIVVSRGRAADLPLCLIGISQLDYPAFEVVLVADADGIAAAQKLPFFGTLKTVLFEEANISQARNLGIAQAAGEIVAFIDDDAVPEPTWLTHLTAGFSDEAVACVGGFVIGRNGISFQWKGRSVDRLAQTTALDIDETRVTAFQPKPERVIKTEGTNMALRRDVLAQMGGFDPAFRFFLDETDVNMRVAQAGHATALAPMAQVHHGYKASAQRHGNRAPRDLLEIAASFAVFLRKHALQEEHEYAIQSMRTEQRGRALRHLVSGGLEPRDIRFLMQRFDAGIAAGRVREIAPLSPLPQSPTPLRKMPRLFEGSHQVLHGRIWQRKAIFLRAEALAQGGQRTSVFLFSPTLLAHRIRFSSAGYWVQSGGLFGRSVRSGPHVLLVSFKKRVAQELSRLSRIRGISPETLRK